MAVEAPAIKLEYDNSGQIIDEQIDLLIDYVVRSEWDRIHNGLGGEGDSQFYFFPELNQKSFTRTSDDGKTKEEITFNDLAKNTNVIDDQIRTALRYIIRERITALSQDKINFWLENDIGTHERNAKNKITTAYKFLPYNVIQEIKKEYNPKKNRELFTYMANDMVFNYMFTLANTFQLFIGDQALYHKKDNKFRNDNTIDSSTREELNKREHLLTLDNLGKRMASEIAPGNAMSNHVFEKETERIFGKSSNSYIQVHLNDFKTQTNPDILKQYTKLFKDNITKEDDTKAYSNIDATDAQEYTTWREHLLIMLSTDKIKEHEYRKLYDALEASETNPNKDLKGDLLKLVMTPLKPVHTSMKRFKVGGNNYERRVYIKSSSFPLLPQLTRGSELDKLRQYMTDLENSQKTTVRASYNTATKVGFPKNVTNIFNEDGTIAEIKAHNWDDEYEVPDGTNIVFEKLDREGFRIQQDVPFKEAKTEINVGSQESKLSFANILDVGVENEKEMFVYDGKKFTGKALKEEYVKLLEAQYERLYDNFSKRFTTKDGVVKTHKIAKVLLDELSRLGTPSVSEVKGLEIDENGEFKTPLWLSPHSKRYSAVINSLITQNTTKRTTRGRSYVLGSEAGFKQLEGENTGIVYTDEYNGKELLPMRVEKDENGNDVVKPAQIMVSFNMFKDMNKLNSSSKGALRLRDFMDGDKIDHSKLPKELLKGFGFRIPTQSHSSMTMYEIVGFLPESQGDLFIAPKEFVAQMGSDFDIDKIYAYTYNTYVNSKGQLVKVKHVQEDFEYLDRETKEVFTKFDKDYDADVQNRILDIHMAIMSNPSDTVQKSIMKPLDMGLLPKYKQLLAKEDTGLQPTYLSDSYNRDKYMSGVSGKSGTAFFAQASVFNAMIQGENVSMYHNIQVNKKNVPVSEQITFGNKYFQWNGDLFEVNSLKKGSKRPKSEIFAGFLSAAVDNEKERLLDSLNINANTFDVIGLLIQAGFEEDIIIPFLNQPAIIDYITQVKKSRSIISESKTEKEIAEELLAKYPTTDPSLADFIGENAEQKMLDLLSKSNDILDYEDYQGALLRKFLDIKDIAEGYRNALQFSNTDSKGLGKNLTESMFKINSMFKVEMEMTPVKVTNVKAAANNSSSGLAFDNYRKGLRLVSNEFVVVTQSEDFKNMMETFAKVTGRDVTELNSQDYENLSEAVKHYVLGNNSDLRRDLLRGENSVRKRLEKISDSDYFKKNNFFNKLELSGREEAKGYDAVTFNMNITNEFINDEIYQHLVDALNKDTEINGVNVAQLAEDLVTYSILDGARFSPLSFSKFLPTIYFERLGLNRRAKGLNIELEYPQIVEQFLQHNPSLAKSAKGKISANGAQFTPTNPNSTPVYVRRIIDTVPALFKKDRDSGVWYRIHTLGDGETLYEYSKPSMTIATSVLNGKPEYKELFSGTDSGGYRSDSKIKTATLTGDEIFDDSEENLAITDAPQDLIKIIKSMNHPLAKEISRLFPNLIDSYTIQLANLGGALGMHSNKGKWIKIDTELYNNGDVYQLEETILHETFHAITVDLLDNRDELSDEQRLLINKISSKRYEVLEKLEGQDLLDFNNFLKQFYNYFYDKADGNVAKAKRLFLNKIDVGDVHKSTDETIAEILKSTTKYPNQEIKNKHSYYSLVNDKEFVAIVATDIDARAFIDKKLGPLSGVAQIKQWIKELFASLGFDMTASGEIVSMIFDLAYGAQSEYIKKKPDMNYPNLGFESHPFNKVTHNDGSFTYVDAEGNDLNNTQIENLKYLTNENPPVQQYEGHPFYFTEEGTVIDALGNEHTYAQISNLSLATLPKEHDNLRAIHNHLKNKDITDDKYKPFNKFKVIADSYIAKQKGTYYEEAGVIYYKQDMFEIGTSEGNILDMSEYEDIRRKILGLDD